MYAELKANAAIIRVVGIFEEKYTKKLEQRFKKLGFENEILSDNTKGFLKNNYYPEFRDLMFISQEPSSAQILHCLLYTSDACRRIERCRSRWSPYH